MDDWGGHFADRRWAEYASRGQCRPGWRATAAALRVDMAMLMLHRLHEMRTEQNTSV